MTSRDSTLFISLAIKAKFPKIVKYNPLKREEMGALLDKFIGKLMERRIEKVKCQNMYSSMEM